MTSILSADADSLSGSAIGLSGSFREREDDFRLKSSASDEDEGSIKRAALEKLPQNVEEGNERLSKRFRDRFDKFGVELPKIEVRFEGLSVEADSYAGSRALPTLLNTVTDIFEGVFNFINIYSQHKKRVNKKILNGVSGILKPSRMTLLLGPPASGKTTLLLALAGKIGKELRVSGKVTYCGYELSEFFPQRTSAYISQHDSHIAEMTVRETFDFSGRCLGVGETYGLISEVLRRERDAGMNPDPEIDAFMKTVSVEGHNSSFSTEYILKMLGLDMCADVIVGNEMRRGISGGEKKRVTTGEMLVGPARALFMDEISTGLDSSTTFRIVKFIKQMVHLMDETVLISLLQPAPETFELFDDVILMSEGLIVYQGPRELILEFFDNMGFKCPVRKGIADFLQEITSRKDQEQYWRKEGQPYRYITASEFSYSFESFHIGKHVEEELRIPFNKSHNHPATLATKRYGMPRWELCKACLSKEWLLMKRNAFVFVFKTVQITIMAVIATTFFLKTQMPHESIGDGGKYLGALFFCLINIMFNGVAEMYMTLIKLPVFYKQRDSLFYPPWAFGLSYIILKIPLSLLESAIWIVITYPGIGFAPTASRFFRQFLAYCVIHQMSFGLFRFIAAVGRTHVITNVCGIFALLVFFVLGGFVVSKDDIQSWWIWCYWISPMMYGQNAIAVNEFLDSRWSKPNNDSSIDQPTIGKAFLKSRSLFVNEYWYWLSIGIIAGFGLLYNIFFILALTYLNPIGNSRTIILKDNEDAGNKNYTKKIKVSRLEISPNASDKPIDSDTETSITSRNYGSGRSTNQKVRQGMVLPFQPLSLIFDQVNYFVDMPVEMKDMGVEGKRLQLLCNVSGAFRPGVLTALVGVSGAGKTTLMDVLAGRKTDGYIEGSITVSGYPKKQETFTRVSGYCEQNDIHSPCISVHESLVFSAWLRLSPEIDEKIRKMFVEEIMELVELNPLRDALVGLPGVDGLSTEQRKRLTIAVELVANPSIIFMDEPTSGLDARAAAIVMRTVSNTVKTGRTVVCTIHQPSIDIFEAFDELLLMKRGGQVIYAGELGHHSSNLIEYFEKIPGVPKILEGKNPATWVLEITTSDAQLSADFAEVYFSSALYKKNQELIKELSNPTPGSKDLTFTTKYGQNFINQFTACFWKQYWSYWRNPQYNVSRFLFTVAAGLLFGTIYWRKGNDIVTQQKLLNLMGAMFTAIFFVGTSNANSVQPVMAIERTVFYRERAAGMFSPMAYAFAKVSIEVIYIVVQSLAFSLLLFSMIDFGWKKDKFFWFFLFFLMFLLYFTLFGLMAISITPNFEISGIFAIFFFLLWNLFAGFILSRKLMPKWWRWIIWANPVAWTLYGLTVSQFGDLENVIEIPGEANMDIKAFLKQRLGFEHDFLGYVVLAHVGFVLIFTFVFAYSLRILNFQKK